MNTRILFQFRLLLCTVIFWAGCESSGKKEGSRISFRIHNARGFKVFLEKVQYADEKTWLIDSAIVKSGDDVIEFKIHNPGERAFKIRVPVTGFEILFINDKPDIQIEASLLQPESFTIKNSPATLSLKNFMKSQLLLMTNARRTDAMVDSMRKINGTSLVADSLEKANVQQMADFFERYKKFADTVSSSGAFIYIYNNVDFGKDYTGLRSFVNRAADRFPEHPRVLKLQKETLDFLKVFEEEYTAGQELPAIQLPDTLNNSFNTALSRGKYVFIDCWSTWCTPCLKYDAPKKKLHSLYGPGKLELISIALDDEKQNWRSYISRNKLNWIQLIDDKIWKGEVVAKWRIDSIPFNFLLDPQGRILRKAIPADSVVTVLSQYVK